MDVALRYVMLFMVVIALGACDLESVLSVDLPGKVVEADLSDAELAETLVNSVITDLECAWAEYSAASAHHSDEYIQASGNLWFRNWGQRRTLADDDRFGTGTCSTTYAFYTPLHTARFQAEDVYARLTSEQFAAVPELPNKLATVRAYGAFALVALAEGFCEMTLPTAPGVPGPLVSDEDVLRLAEARFTEALDLADQAGNDDIRNMALVGRARVRLDLEDFAGVIEDALAVTPGYIKYATRDESDGRRNNFNFDVANDHENTPHASVADNYRELTIDPEGRPTESDGVPDTRVNVETAGNLGHNNVTIIWYHDKYPSRSAPMPIASYKAAQLFLAEAYVRTDELALARDVINARRVEVGLPEFTPVATQDEMLALVLEERRRDLFVEGGHRFNDMLRFRGTAFEIPFLGEPGSIHPDGVDNIGAEYGDLTCYPLPTIERIGNPNIS
jgi:hypothetical protein